MSVCLLMVTSSATAQPVRIEPEEISDFQFQSVHFGQAPVAGMVLREKPGHPDRTMTSRASAVLNYVDRNDSLSVGTVLIEPPSYLFWNDQLFSIGFRPDCSDAQLRSCFETVVNALDQEYNLTRIGYRHQENIFGSHDRWEFLTDSNTLVFASITISAGTVIQSYVRFTDKYLADQMGNENNPDKYNPFEVWMDRERELSQHNQCALLQDIL
jgi:hypothetical protein